MLTTVILFCLLQAAPSSSFVDQSIASAKEKIAKEPKSAEGFNELALALTRKERETGDVAFLAQAEANVQRSLQLAPGNFEARKARVAIRLRQQRYEDALEEAQALNKQIPDDNPMYGFLCEAYLALGNYAKAESSVQFMLNLRQVNGPGYERGAVIRETIGFPDAAVEWWNSSLHLASERDTEERAYIQSQLVRVYREMGKYDAAAESARQALALFPAYPPALFELARLRMDQGNAAEATALLEKLPTLEPRYWLAVANPNEPSRGAGFEKAARAASNSPANANALLIRYWADHGKSSEALALGRETLKRRHDIATLHAYAWAEYRAGEYAGALESIRKALAPGFRDAPLCFEAGMIAKAAGETAAAIGYFKKAYEINSNAPTAPETLKMLGMLSPSL